MSSFPTVFPFLQIQFHLKSILTEDDGNCGHIRVERIGNAKELENGKSPLNYVKLMINKNYEELSRKEKRLEEVQRLIREKETKYDLMQNRIKEATQNLNRSKLVQSEEAVQN